MNQPQNGQDDYIKAILENLEKYETSLGVHKNKLPYDVDYYNNIMSLNQSQLDRLTLSECAQYCVILSQYSLYVAKCYNNNRTIAKILEHKLKECVSRNINQYKVPGTSWEMQEQAAINGDEYTLTLSKKVLEYQTKAERLYSISDHIQKYSDTLRNLQYTKAKEVNNEER